MELPRLSFVKARSSLAMLLIIVPQLLAAFGIIDPVEVPAIQAEGKAVLDQAFLGIEHIASAAGAVWLWVERRNPKRRIGLASDPATN